VKLYVLDTDHARAHHPGRLDFDNIGELLERIEGPGHRGPSKAGSMFESPPGQRGTSSLGRAGRPRSQQGDFVDP
jgi:hypothetical protein